MSKQSNQLSPRQQKISHFVPINKSFGSVSSIHTKSTKNQISFRDNETAQTEHYDVNKRKIFQVDPRFMQKLEKKDERCIKSENEIVSPYVSSENATEKVQSWLAENTKEATVIPFIVKQKGNSTPNISVSLRKDKRFKLNKQPVTSKLGYFHQLKCIQGKKLEQYKNFIQSSEMQMDLPVKRQTISNPEISSTNDDISAEEGRAKRKRHNGDCSKESGKCANKHNCLKKNSLPESKSLNILNICCGENSKIEKPSQNKLQLGISNTSNDPHTTSEEDTDESQACLRDGNFTLKNDLSKTLTLLQRLNKNDLSRNSKHDFKIKSKKNLKFGKNKHQLQFFDYLIFFSVITLSVLFVAIYYNQDSVEVFLQKVKWWLADMGFVSVRRRKTVTKWEIFMKIITNLVTNLKSAFFQ